MLSAVKFSTRGGDRHQAKLTPTTSENAKMVEVTAIICPLKYYIDPYFYYQICTKILIHLERVQPRNRKCDFTFSISSLTSSTKLKQGEEEEEDPVVVFYMKNFL